MFPQVVSMVKSMNAQVDCVSTLFLLATFLMDITKYGNFVR